MSIKTAVKTAVLLLSLSIFSACGELSTPLLSSDGTYQIRALVNGSSLESCSIIRQNDKIIPYFATSVVNDPDLMGLLVYLRNPKGEIVGEKVLYTIDPVNEATQQETSQEETKDDDNDSAGDNDSEGETAEDKNDETAGQTEEETSEPVVREKINFIDSKPPVKKYDIVIPIKSFEDEMPHFPLPKDLEIGQYSLVFEAVGRFNTLSSTESYIFYLGSVEFKLNDISMSLPWFSDTGLIPPGATVMLEAGLDFDSRLNPYVIWYNGKNIISEGNITEGAGNILWKAPEQAGFYSLRLEVLPYKLKRNFTGLFREITLPVSTKTSNTGYFFGNSPDFAARRPLAAGTAYFEQLQLTQTAARAAAAAKIATAVSTPAAARTAASAPPPAEKDDKAAPIPPEYPELLRWYRFEGNLDDKSSLQERMLEAVNEKAPRWASVGQTFGLFTGPDDMYTLGPVSFIQPGQEQGGGIFLFHIRPAPEEIVFNAFFPLLASATDGVWMDIVMRKDDIVLRLKTIQTSFEIPVSLGYPGLQGLIPIVVEFYIRPYRFEAKLSIGEDSSRQSTTGELKISGALSGESRISLGGNKTAPTDSGDNSGEISAETEENTVIEKVKPANVTTVWDEFAVLYSSTPLLPEEIPVETNPETQNTPDEETARTPITNPAAAVIEIPPAVKEEIKPIPADPKPSDNKPTDSNPAPETEAPLADIQTENTPAEPAAAAVAAETRQGPETETPDEEEHQLLISIQ